MKYLRKAFYLFLCDYLQYIHWTGIFAEAYSDSHQCNFFPIPFIFMEINWISNKLKISIYRFLSWIFRGVWYTWVSMKTILNWPSVIRPVTIKNCGDFLVWFLCIRNETGILFHSERYFTADIWNCLSVLKKHCSLNNFLSQFKNSKKWFWEKNCDNYNSE